MDGVHQLPGKVIDAYGHVGQAGLFAKEQFQGIGRHVQVVDYVAPPAPRNGYLGPQLKGGCHTLLIGDVDQLDVAERHLLALEAAATHFNVAWVLDSVGAVGQDPGDIDDV